MFETLSERQRALLAIAFVTALLVGIDYKFSHESWYFALAMVFAWPLEERLFGFLGDAFDINESLSPFGFLLYIVAVLVAAAMAAYLGQRFLSQFHLPTIGNITSGTPHNVTNINSTTSLSLGYFDPFEPIGFWTVLGVSAVTSSISYLIANFADLNARYHWF